MNLTDSGGRVKDLRFSHNKPFCLLMERQTGAAFRAGIVQSQLWGVQDSTPACWAHSRRPAGTAWKLSGACWRKSWACDPLEYNKQVLIEQSISSECFLQILTKGGNIRRREEIRRNRGVNTRRTMRMEVIFKWIHKPAAFLSELSFPLKPEMHTFLVGHRSHERGRKRHLASRNDSEMEEEGFFWSILA